jgi:hypothetical protein
MIEHVRIHQQNLSAAGHRIGGRVHGEDAAELELIVHHDLGTGAQAQPIELALDQLAAKAERENHLLDAGLPQQHEVPFEEALAVEPQQALRQLPVLGRRE